MNPAAAAAAAAAARHPVSPALPVIQTRQKNSRDGVV